MNALLIAEDPDEVAILSLVLQRAGLTVATARNLEWSMQQWPDQPADLILLALASPPWPEQVRRVRAETQVPLVMVASSASEEMQCELLRLGADFVVTPPFSPKLLIAQIYALMRRGDGILAFSLPSLSIGEISLDPVNRMVTIGNRATRRLTYLEFRLLYTLIINRGQVVPTETIVERVWGHTGQGDRELVRGLVSRLRTKIENDAHQPRYILTVPGVGYTCAQE
jgi:DNA-binding response OmpR family regulator